MVLTSSFAPSIGPPPFAPVSYKPSNPVFAQDGGQMGSAQTARIIHNTVVSNHRPHKKEIPIKQTPVFSKYGSGMRKCVNYKIR